VDRACWEDSAFKASFPDFGTERYWQEQIEALVLQLKKRNTPRPICTFEDFQTECFGQIGLNGAERLNDWNVWKVRGPVMNGPRTISRRLNVWNQWNVWNVWKHLFLTSSTKRSA
jgi:hypothetical protein